LSPPRRTSRLVAPRMRQHPECRAHRIIPRCGNTVAQPETKALKPYLMSCQTHNC